MVKSWLVGQPVLRQASAGMHCILPVGSQVVAASTWLVFLAQERIGQNRAGGCLRILPLPQQVEHGGAARGASEAITGSEAGGSVRQAGRPGMHHFPVTPYTVSPLSYWAFLTRYQEL